MRAHARRTRTASRDARTHRSPAVFQASPSEVGGSWGFHSKQAFELNEPRVLGLLKGWNAELQRERRLWKGTRCS